VSTEWEIGLKNRLTSGASRTNGRPLSSRRTTASGRLGALAGAAKHRQGNRGSGGITGARTAKCAFLQQRRAAQTLGDLPARETAHHDFFLCWSTVYLGRNKVAIQFCQDKMR
jgi:hypothetical protein